MEQRLIYCTESNMKVFDEHFVERLLEGGKGKSQMDIRRRRLFFF